MRWVQKTLELKPRSKGCHIVTDEIAAQLPELKDFKEGMLQLFLLHTSASLTINENASPDVRRDMELAADRLAPEDLPYAHTEEGPDDMPAHVKSSVFGVSLLIPVRDGRLFLGTWQGIYLWEHRVHAGARRVVVSVFGP